MALYSKLKRTGLSSDILINILMVNEGARPGAMFFAKRETDDLIKKIDILRELTPKLKYIVEKKWYGNSHNYVFIFNPKGKNKKYYDSKKNKMKMPRDEKKIGDFLGFTCVGEMNFDEIKNTFAIRYLGNNTIFYTEVCWKLTPKRVKQIKSQYKKMKEVGKKNGIDIKLEIEVMKGNPNLDLIK